MGNATAGALWLFQHPDHLPLPKVKAPIRQYQTMGTSIHRNSRVKPDFAPSHMRDATPTGSTVRLPRITKEKLSAKEALTRLESLSNVMDSAIQIPGTSHRVGLDSLIGLIPGIGDAASALISCYILFEGRRLGVPKRKLAAMVTNILVDSVVGAVPIVGDVFDVTHKANLKNTKIVRDHLKKTGQHLDPYDV